MKIVFLVALSLITFSAFADNTRLENCIIDEKENELSKYSVATIKTYGGEESLYVDNFLVYSATPLDIGMSMGGIGISTFMNFGKNNTLRISSPCKSEFVAPVETEKYLFYNLKCGESIKEPIEMTQTLAIDKSSNKVVFSRTKRRDDTHFRGKGIEIKCQDKSFDAEILKSE